jgi:hypothetical protein
VFILALLVLSLAAVVSAVLLRVSGIGVAVRDLGITFATILAASEISLLAIRLLKGRDQSSAAQAGLGGMVSLMLLSVGLLGACLMMGVLTSDAAIRCSPLLFVTALVLVATDAIRTIRSASAGNPGATKEQPDKVK